MEINGHSAKRVQDRFAHVCLARGFSRGSTEIPLANQSEVLRKPFSPMIFAVHMEKLNELLEDDFEFRWMLTHRIATMPSRAGGPF